MPKTVIEMCRSFRSMNTCIEVVVCIEEDKCVAGEKALDDVQSLFIGVEETLSRFNPESELSRLNASAGYPFQVSEFTFKVVKAALEAARMTNGLFEPAVLPSLLAAGYDRSFEQLPPRTSAFQPGHSLPGFSWKDIKLDPINHTIYMPEGCGIDLGGIGKSWAVDRICSELNQNFSGYAVDAGGDIFVGGKRADGSLWSIGIADSFSPDRDLAVLEISDLAICTSSTKKRSWLAGGRHNHHIIDPRTGKPSSTGVAAATVMAESTVRAEIISKTAILLGPEAGIRFIEEQVGVSGLLVLENRSILRSKGFPEVCYVP